MRLNDPLDLLSFKVLGFGVRVDLVEATGEGFLPDTATLCINVSLAVYERSWRWELVRR